MYDKRDALREAGKMDFVRRFPHPSSVLAEVCKYGCLVSFRVEHADQPGSGFKSCCSENSKMEWFKADRIPDSVNAGRDLQERALPGPHRGAGVRPQGHRRDEQRGEGQLERRREGALSKSYLVAYRSRREGSARIFRGTLFVNHSIWLGTSALETSPRN